MPPVNENFCFSAELPMVMPAVSELPSRVPAELYSAAIHLSVPPAEPTVKITPLTVMFIGMNRAAQ